VSDVTVRCRTAGQNAGEEYMEVRCGKHRCGEIVGGVGIQLSSLRGVFVVDFADLETAYLAAKKVRESSADGAVK
jgi:hypothetical protein